MILAGGAINSPQLLKLSGIGPAARSWPRTASRSSPTGRASAPISPTIWKSTSRSPATQPITLYSSLGLLPKAHDRRALAAAPDGARRHQPFRELRLHPQRGPACAGPTCSTISCRPPSPTTARIWPTGTGSRPMSARCARRAGAASRCARPTRATSRRIRFNYMSHPDDWTEMRAAVRLTREIFAQPAFAPYRGEEIEPGAGVTSDDAHRRLHPRAGSRAPIIPAPPAAWARADDPLRGRRTGHPGDRRRGPAGGRFARSCRPSPPATSTRRRSCWPRRPPTTSAAGPRCRRPTHRSIRRGIGRWRSVDCAGAGAHPARGAPACHSGPAECSRAPGAAGPLLTRS